MKNRIVSDATKAKLSSIKKGVKTGKVPKSAFKKGCTSWNKGKNVITNSGATHFKKGSVPWNKNKKNLLSEESIEKMRQSALTRLIDKTKHPRYKIDRDSLVKNEKKHLDSFYKEWALKVKKRDNWKCRIQNQDCKGRLEAHHILPWRTHKNLRYEINNGITLCQAHHPKGVAEEKRLESYFMELVSVLKV